MSRKPSTRGDDALWPCPLAVGAVVHGDWPFLTDCDGAVTWAQASQRVHAIAARLREAGLGPGARLAVVSRPDATAFLLAIACFRAGITACLLNPRHPPVVLGEQIRAARCAAVTGSALPAGAPVPGGCPAAPWEGWATPGGAADAPPAFHGPSQWATIMYTSGSSGAPKAAVLTWGNHWENARAANRMIPVVPGDRWLASLPLCHVAGTGVLFRCLAGGGAIAPPALGADLADVLKDPAITHVSLVPAQLWRLLQAPGLEGRLRRLKAILLGGGPIPPALLDAAARSGLPVHITYGMTEAASQIATSGPIGPEDLPEPGAAPLLQDCTRIGGGGEIQICGPTLFAGYLDGGGNDCRRPETCDGWFPTGDLGLFDDRGRLHVTGRKDNMFISGGENIQPEAIEAELCRAPGVAAAIVVPVTDPEFGARPEAFVRFEGETAPNLRVFLERRLPRYMIPRAFHPWPSHLDGGRMKPDRRAFQRLACDRRGPNEPGTAR